MWSGSEFARVLTAQLSWRVQNYDLAVTLEMKSQQTFTKYCRHELKMFQKWDLHVWVNLVEIIYSNYQQHAHQNEPFNLSDSRFKIQDSK